MTSNRDGLERRLNRLETDADDPAADLVLWESSNADGSLHDATGTVVAPENADPIVVLPSDVAH